MDDRRRSELATDGGVSVAEAARFLGVSRSLVYEYMGAGRLAYGKLGTRRIVPRAALVRLLADGLVGGEGAIGAAGGDNRLSGGAR